MTINYKNGSYVLEELTLINFRGQETNIQLMFESIDMFEDLFSSSCYGHLILLDATDLKQNFPLIGEERIRIRYKTAPEFETVQREFYVIEQDDVDEQNQSGAHYRLNFASEELLANKALRLSRAFMSATPSQITKLVFSQLDTNKKITIDESIGQHTYVAANLHPFKIINEMTLRSASKISAGSCFVFYENKFGYQYRDLENLYKQTPISYTNGSASREGDPAQKFKIVTGSTTKSSFNTLDKIQDGSIGSTVKELNILRRSSSEQSYDSLDDKQYKAVSKVGSNDPTARQETSMFKYKNASKSAVNYRITSESNPQQKARNMPFRASQLNKLRTGSVLNVSMPGNSELYAGCLIDLTIPSKSIDDDTMQTNDKFNSGVYLVTALRETITKTEFTSTVELTRDSYSSNHEEFDQSSRVNAK